MANLKIYLSSLTDRRNYDGSLAQSYTADLKPREGPYESYDPYGTIYTFNINPLTNVRDTRYWYY
jgi:hypothetical protein